ncbi:sulfite exporter TauE/SafE family protein [Streptomyces acidiscabies]|uniref:sulfite exporter TauE/SafE family protein n=1 Tax=Streptomyces acidiscabies TaxID=42234 RepID=UPI000A855185|nr:sulfite exporter TauE/SafE family protein [Streptomyces acidiscabies]
MTVTVLALLAGAVVGLALGALGGGGSVLAVPALIYLLGFTPVAATTASLVIVAVTSATALSAHARDGHVQWRTGLLFAAAGVVPAMLGGLLAARLPGRVLTLAFAVVAVAAGLRMLGVRVRALRRSRGGSGGGGAAEWACGGGAARAGRGLGGAAATGRASGDAAATGWACGGGAARTGQGPGGAAATGRAYGGGAARAGRESGDAAASGGGAATSEWAFGGGAAVAEPASGATTIAGAPGENAPRLHLRTP